MPYNQRPSLGARVGNWVDNTAQTMPVLNPDPRPRGGGNASEVVPVPVITPNPNVGATKPPPMVRPQFDMSAFQTQMQNWAGTNPQNTPGYGTLPQEQQAQMVRDYFAARPVNPARQWRLDQRADAPSRWPGAVMPVRPPNV